MVNFCKRNVVIALHSIISLLAHKKWEHIIRDSNSA